MGTTTSKSVSERFDTFLSNIELTSAQAQDGGAKHGGVRSCLNQHYYDTTSTSANSMLVGSWGKHTRIRPPRDVDVLFKLPWSVHERFERRTGNKQAQLLQEVKDVLATTYPRTDIRGDRNVVVVGFGSYAVEVVPAFEQMDSKFLIPDSTAGGKYKPTDYHMEAAALSVSDVGSSGNTRHLIRMLKRWQAYCNVPIKSYWLELLAIGFIDTWDHRGKNSVYYDWMVRDFLAYLRTKRNTYVWGSGLFELISIGDAWYSRAETAHDRAATACQYDSERLPYSASIEWQKVFGLDFPSP